MPKPFNPREPARVKAVLRRTRPARARQAQERETLRFPGLIIDQTGRVVQVGAAEKCS